MENNPELPLGRGQGGGEGSTNISLRNNISTGAYSWQALPRIKTTTCFPT